MAKKKWLKAVIFLAVVVGVMAWISSRPSKGKIVLTKKVPEEEVNKKTIEQRQYLGKFLNFWYGSNYLIRIREEPVKSESEKVELFGGTGDSSHWVITADEIKVPDLEEVSGVQFRRLNKDLYEEDEAEISSSSGLFFKKRDKTEYLVLAIKNNKLITVALTINSNDEATEQKFLNFVERVEIK